MIAVSPRQLEVFCAIAAAGSVRAAADQLGLTQPAASMALAELERLLGAPLFDRHQRRLRLNEHGRGVLPRAREIVERLRELGADLQPRGTLTIGASNTIGNYLVGDLLGGFVAGHPDVKLSLRVANSAEIVQGVLDFELDVGCIEAPAAHADLELLPWRRDELKVCVRADHPLAARKRLRADDLRGQRWILRESGSGTRSIFEDASRDVLGPLEVALELGQSEAIKQAVIAGLGIACLPRAAIADALASGQLVALPTPFLALERTLSLVLHRARWRGATLQAFLRRVRA
ncbi:MAG: LysR family transcriptional regulator [Rhodanobacteraceae bacterium]|jgi:DNA-binding transcriptional LysR family regulator|nr:LysR family transcriptional regulator [Rhodanobacteraceae bacterium]